MMIGIYNGEKYKANVEEKDVILVTHDQKKCTDGFEKKRDYYKRRIAIDDPKLENLYDIHFFVNYQGENWNVDEGKPSGLDVSLENYEVVLDVSHDAIDDTWTQYDKGASAKIISMLECSNYFIEKTYLKKDSICLDEKTTETNQVDAQTLRDQMLSLRNI